MKLTILRGISGSGKSTWAKSQDDVIVSRDRIREFLFGKFSMENEGLVTTVQDATISGNLASGNNVIVDNTNIEWKYVKALADIGYEFGADVEIKVFDVPLHVANARVGLRALAGGLDVPTNVVVKQHSRFQGSKNKTLDEPEAMVPYKLHGAGVKPWCVLVDIDGTIAHMKDRSPFEWHRVGEDTIDERVQQIVDTLAYDNDIIYFSGRDSAARDATVEWLDDNGMDYESLFMRAEGDMRKDSIVKYEMFNEHIRDNYNVLCVLDDRNQVVEMWRELGLTCLQVAEGNF